MKKNIILIAMSMLLLYCGFPEYKYLTDNNESKHILHFFDDSLRIDVAARIILLRSRFNIDISYIIKNNTMDTIQISPCKFKLFVNQRNIKPFKYRVVKLNYYMINDSSFTMDKPIKINGNLRFNLLCTITDSTVFSTIKKDPNLLKNHELIIDSMYFSRKKKHYEVVPVTFIQPKRFFVKIGTFR